MQGRRKNLWRKAGEVLDRITKMIRDAAADMEKV
jgi:hypothetical protein